MSFGVLAMLTILSVGGGVQGELQLLLQTSPPTVGDEFLFCASIETILTITCEYSSTFRFNPSIVINRIPLSASELDNNTYTASYTESGGVVLQLSVSSDFNGYTFSCRLNETVTSRTITLLADIHQCPVDVNATVTSAESATSSPEVPTGAPAPSTAPTSPIPPLPSQTPAPGGNGTDTVTSAESATISPEVSTGAPAPSTAPTSPIPPLPSQAPAPDGNGNDTMSPLPNDNQLVLPIVLAVVAVVVLLAVVLIGVVVGLLYYKKKQAKDGNGVGRRAESDRQGHGLVVQENPIAAPADIPDQQEGGPQGQVIREEDDQDEEDDPEGRHDLEERDELLESDGPEEQDQSVEQYSNSNAAASDAFEEDSAGLRPRTEGGGDSEEDLDTAVEESSGRSNTAQSDLAVSNGSSPHAQSPSPTSNPPSVE